MTCQFTVVVKPSGKHICFIKHLFTQYVLVETPTNSHFQSGTGTHTSRTGLIKKSEHHNSIEHYSGSESLSEQSIQIKYDPIALHLDYQAAAASPAE